MDVIKKESYHSLHMWNEHHGAASVRGNNIVNTPVPVLYTEVWSSHKTIEHHVLNIFYPHGLRDVQRPEILPNRD